MLPDDLFIRLTCLVRVSESKYTWHRSPWFPPWGVPNDRNCSSQGYSWVSGGPSDGTPGSCCLPRETPISPVPAFLLKGGTGARNNARWAKSRESGLFIFSHTPLKTPHLHSAFGYLWAKAIPTHTCRHVLVCSFVQHVFAEHLLGASPKLMTARLSRHGRPAARASEGPCAPGAVSWYSIHVLCLLCKFILF